MQTAALEDGKVLTHHSHVAAVVIAERLYNPATPNLRVDHTPDEAALLNRDLRHTRQWMAILSCRCRITDDEYLGVILEIQQRPNAGTPGAICGDAELLDDGRGLNTCRPQHRIAR